MNICADEDFFIKKAKLAQENDPFTAKAWIISAKTLFPNNFFIQFEAYLQEKAANNYLEAAKCFSYIVMTFQNQPPELWQEISKLTTALRAPDDKITKDDKFYVEMFQHISYEVQNKILSNLNTENNLDYCKFVLLLMKKFPQATQTHLPRLIDTLLQSNTVNKQIALNMLIHDVIPLMHNKPPDLPPALAQRLMTLGLEYYVPQMFLRDNKGTITIDVEDNVHSKLSMTACWKRIFEIKDICSRILKWEPFLPYNANWSKDVYWQKLIPIVALTSTRPNENKQILFYTAILFIMSLQDYVNNTKQKIDDVEVRYILIEGLRDGVDVNYDPHRMYIEPPHLTVSLPLDEEVAISFRTAVQCWQLLHSNELIQMDFKQLLLSLPCLSYISPFLIDLAFYVGRPDDRAILHDSSLGTLEKNLRYLSLTLHQTTFQIQSFDFLMKIIPDLPNISGTALREVSKNIKTRHCLFLPLTKKAILQYCTKIIINALKLKLFNETKKCSDSTLGNLLVLLQLNWPAEYQLAEMVFDHIRAKQNYVYFNFVNYIVCSDFLEEFMNIYLHAPEVRLELAPQQSTSQRRIGTRNVDKGIKDDFKQLIRKQFLRAYDDVDALIVQFLSQEHMCLVQNIFEK